jgi:hypothetical protein
MAEFNESVWPRNEHQHAGGSLNRTVNPGRFFWGKGTVEKYPQAAGHGS